MNLLISLVTALQIQALPPLVFVMSFTLFYNWPDNT
jgi:hypothetical protein